MTLGIMRPGSARVAPWPYDAVFVLADATRFGVMLYHGRPSDPWLIGEQPDPLQAAAPGEMAYSAQNPVVEGTTAYDDLVLGFGQRIQQTTHDKRYRYASNLDCSISGQTILGPVLVQGTPSTVDATNGISNFFELGSLLYALNGRYALVRTEAQEIATSGSPTGGTFTVTYGADTTTALAQNVSAANMQTALRLLTGLSAVTVTRTSVAGTSNFVWTVVMTGAGTNPDAMTAASSLTGGASPAVTIYSNDNGLSWTTSKDFGAGKAGLDVIVATQNVAGSTTYAYTAMGDAEFFYRFDGTTWNQHASLYRRCFALVGTRLYAIRDVNMLCQVDMASDPWTAGNWNDVGRIGEYGSAAQRLLCHPAGFLLIFKTDGVYVLDEDGNDIQLFKFSAINTDNGKHVWVDRNWVHCTYNGQHFRIGPDMDLEHIGPERFAGNDSGVSGYIMAGVGTAFASFAGLYNPDTGSSYLMKFGAYADSQDGAPERIDAWHGSLSPVDIPGLSSEDAEKWLSQKITAMWRTGIGAPTNHERLYIGSSTGVITHAPLPCTPNPIACTQYVYEWSDSALPSKDGFLFFPYWHGGFPKEEKVIRMITTTGTFPSSSLSVYALLFRSAGTTGNYSTVAGQPIASATPGGRDSLAQTTTLADLGLQLLGSAAVAVVTSTPILTGSALHYRVNPNLQQSWQLPVLAENGLIKRDGSVMRLGADRIKANIKTALGTTAGVTLVIADEGSYTVQLAQYREEMIWDNRARQWRSVVHVTAIQSDITASGGVVSALS